MTRLPIRLRIAAAFAVAMAVVLAGTGWFLYARLDSHLTTALDHNLLVRAQDVTALIDRPGARLASAGCYCRTPVEHSVRENRSAAE